MAMVERWGGVVKITTIIRDFNTLRLAIRAHDLEAIEAAWLDCERWLEFVYWKADQSGKTDKT